jgi:hypothetical protein
LSINKLLNKELFLVYENIEKKLKEIKSSEVDLEEKKIMMSGLMSQYQSKLTQYKDNVVKFAKSFVEKFNLTDNIISARVGSPTPYGNQPKDYLWSGISIDKEKSYSFQYSWVFQPDKLEVTFCFGSGGSATGNVDEEKRVERENNLRKLEENLYKLLLGADNKAILEDLIKNEGFVITSNWLKKDLEGSQDIQSFIDVLRKNNGAKSGITRYFSKEELLSEGFNLEGKIYRYFEIFKPIWDQLHVRKDATYPKDIQNGDLIKEDKENSKITDISYSEVEIINHINNYILSKGFYYDKEELTNLYLSIKTKPFVIISGISGTGKTKVIKWFAESVGATERNGRFTLIPVRPDWSDGSDLIGYRDIQGGFKDGPLTKVIRQAKQNPDKPFFVLLDEMNLARVEYYFSDLLSVMESRDWKDGGITSSLILTEEEAGEAIWFPDNLYIIGTVNMDETTHPFSKKVLDRANTIEFNRVQLDYLDFLADLAPVEHKNIENIIFRSDFLYLKDVAKSNMSLVEEVSQQLIQVNSCLQPIGAQIGYRVRDEICMYLAYNQSGQLLTKEEAFDNSILQKILPRISGSDSRVKRTLTELFRFLINKIVELDIENYEHDIPLSLYPKSAAKVYEMLRRLEDDNFTSFWIS